MYVCVCVCAVASVLSSSLWPHGLKPTRLLCPWDSPGKKTGVGCYALLQGIFPTQGSNPCLLCPLHWQMNTLPLTPPGRSINVVTQFRFWNLFNQFTTGMDRFLCLSVLKDTILFKVCIVYNCTSVSQFKPFSTNGHFDHSILCW